MINLKYINIKHNWSWEEAISVILKTDWFTFSWRIGNAFNVNQCSAFRMLAYYYVQVTKSFQILAN